MEILTQKNKKEFNLTKYFFLFLLISLLVNSLQSLYLTNGEINLNWPETQIIPNIKIFKGYLSNDFLSGASIGSVYSHLGSFLSALLPDKNEDLISSFILLNNFFKSCNQTLLIFSIFSIITLLRHKFKKPFEENQSFTFFIYLTLFVFTNLINSPPEVAIKEPQFCSER